MMVVAARKLWSWKHLLTRLAWVALMLMLLQSAGVAGPALAVESNSGVSAVPLVFTRNVGQTAARVLFEARGLGGELFFTPQEVVLALPAAKVIRLQFEAANPAPLVEGREQLSSTVNYFKGRDPEGWHTGIPTFSSLIYRELYPGTDLIYEGADGLLKGTFRVAPGANPQQISWHYTGAEMVGIDPTSGDLRIRLADGSQLLERAPVAWQLVNGRRVPVAVQFVMNDQTVGFAIADYDPTLELILDPVLEYSTYLGGSDRDVALGVEVDEAGFVYVTGLTSSPDFPMTDQVLGSQLQGTGDAFVLKIDPQSSGAASLVWATYLGGTHPSSGQPNSLGGVDEANAIALDGDGNIYVAGSTRSTDFPVTSSAYQTTNPIEPQLWIPTAFLAKLSPDGDSLLYSTYLGGSSVDQAFAVAADDTGNAYVGGMTQSRGQNGSIPFPTTANAYDSAGTSGAQEKVFVSKIDTGLSGATSLVYSTFLGGTLAGQPAMGMAADATGNVYVTGLTRDTSFPVTPNAFQENIKIDPDTGNPSEDAYISQIDTTQSGAASLVYSTYFGGSKAENWAALLASEGFYPTTLSPDISAAGNGIIYVTGGTMSADFPIVNGFQTVKGGFSGNSVYPPHYDAFVARFNTQKTGAASLEYSTYLGGTQFDFGTGIKATRQGNVYITGSTAAPNFPLRDAIQSRIFGGISAFATKIDTNLSGSDSLVYSTYVGRNSLNYGGIAVDSVGTAYLAGAVADSNFPIVAGFQSVYGGSTDGFLIKLAFRSDLEVTKNLVPDPAVVGEPLTITIDVKNKGPETATAIFLTEVLPDTVLTFVSATPTQGTCEYLPGVLRCDLGYLEDQQIATVVIEVMPEDPTLFASPSNGSMIVSQAEDLPVVLATVDEVEQELNQLDNVAQAALSIYTFDTFVPVLLAPSDHALTSDTTPTFQWQPIPGAVQYELQYSQGDLESAPVITSDSSSFTPTASLLTTTYVWRVRGVAADDRRTVWSTAVVTIAAASNAAPERNLLTSGVATLTWGRVTWASRYEIEVDNNSNFRSPEYEDDTLGPDVLSIPLPPLPEGKFYWRVRAGRENGTWGSWSKVDSFVVRLP